MNKDGRMTRAGWTALGLGTAVLAAVVGVGLVRHPFRDGDAGARSPAPTPAAGEVRLDARSLRLAGIETGPAVPRRGSLLLPESALVCYGGDEDVYVALAPGDFIRRRVTGIRFTPKGDWGRVRGWKPGQELVTRGAQTVLSQEFKPRPSGGGDDDDDD